MTAPSPAADLARRLAREAEAVCRHYLSNGRREGRYWLVGDVANSPGRSLYVRLRGPDSGNGAAGKWTDAATGEHGDLLDLIAGNLDLKRLGDVLQEARSFLSLARSEPEPNRAQASASRGSPESARRLFSMSQPIAGTIAETYLRRRGITGVRTLSALRFHPRCYYRPHEDASNETWPALIAAVTDLSGAITGIHRTYLDPRLNNASSKLSNDGKAPIESPRRAIGHLLGHGVRFGKANDVTVAGEGIETMLSLRLIMPTLPMIAALSANHLASIHFPATLRRLYIARDADAAGDMATAALTERAEAAGIEAITLSPTQGDFNEDLRDLGARALCAALLTQFAPEDAERSL